MRLCVLLLLLLGKNNHAFTACEQKEKRKKTVIFKHNHPVRFNKKRIYR